MKSIVMLFGLSGAGKSGVANALLTGSSALCGLPLPEDLFEHPRRNCIGATGGAIVHAASAKQSVRGMVEDALQDVGAIILEPWHASVAICEECAADYRIVPLHVCVSPWMVEARLRLRLERTDRMHTLPRLLDVVYTQPQDLVDYAHRATPGVEPLLVDARDWPLRLLTDDAARELLTPQPVRVPVLHDIAQQYQQALHINGIWFGRADSRRHWEQDRLNAILPARLDGQVLLDIGASEGAFSFEAVNRGAAYCQAVELRQQQVDWLREWRDAAQAPIGTALLDIAQEPIPPLVIADEPTRYDLGLLLNVLHHTRTPERAAAMLGKILDACEAVVVEGPHTATDTALGTPTHGNALCVSDGWMQAVGEAHGFRLDGTEESIMQPPYRRVWRLSRAHREGA